VGPSPTSGTPLDSSLTKLDLPTLGAPTNANVGSVGSTYGNVRRERDTWKGIKEAAAIAWYPAEPHW